MQANYKHTSTRLFFHIVGYTYSNYIPYWYSLGMIYIVNMKEQPIVCL